MWHRRMAAGQRRRSAARPPAPTLPPFLDRFPLQLTSTLRFSSPLKRVFRFSSNWECWSVSTARYVERDAFMHQNIGFLSLHVLLLQLCFALNYSFTFTTWIWYFIEFESQHIPWFFIFLVFFCASIRHNKLHSYHYERWYFNLQDK